MTKENMNRIHAFCMEDNIELDEEIISLLNKLEYFRYFDLLSLNKDVIKLLLKNNVKEAYSVAYYLLYEKKEEQLYFINKVINESDCSKRECLASAIKSKKVRKDKELFSLIYAQKNHLQQAELLKAINDKKIGKRRDLINLIAFQPTEDCKKELRIALSRWYIRRSKELLDLIVSQKDSESMFEMRLAIQTFKIRRNKHLLNLIAKQDNACKKKTIREACEYKELLPYIDTIAALKTSGNQKQMMRAFSSELIRNNKKIIDILLQEKNYKIQANIIDAALVDEIREKNFLLSIVLDEKNYDRQYLLLKLLKIKAVRENYTILLSLSSLNMDKLQNLDNYINIYGEKILDNKDFVEELISIGDIYEMNENIKNQLGIDLLKEELNRTKSLPVVDMKSYKEISKYTKKRVLTKNNKKDDNRK